MSCFDRSSGETDDTGRIQRAVDAIPSGKLIFNEGSYLVSNTINLDYLDSFLVIEGTSTNNLVGSVTTSSHIRMTATNKAIFKIGENVFDVTIRDLGLSADSNTGTVGILAQGTYVSPTVATSSLHFEFSNIRFTGFAYGIKAEALDANKQWQFDSVKVSHCEFEGDTTGILVDSTNSGWQISGLEMYIPNAGIGIQINNNSYSTIDSVIGNGPSMGIGDSLIYIKSHGVMRISNCVAEIVSYDIRVDGPSLAFPIYLESNTFQNQVDVSKATVVSIGNQFGIENPAQGVSQSPMPKARNGAYITSLSDKFCMNFAEPSPQPPGRVPCVDGDWKFETDAQMLYSTGEFKNTTSRRTFMSNYLAIQTDLYFDPFDQPLLSIFTNLPPNNKPLLRLGQAGYQYTLKMDDATKWLKFEGNQTAPNVGFSFNGPVKLPSYGQSGLPTSTANGSMVFCTDCLPNTTPCQGGGGGALALSVSGGWSCK